MNKDGILIEGKEDETNKTIIWTWFIKISFSSRVVSKIIVLIFRIEIWISWHQS